MEHRFQIDLRGLIDLLSNHLYSSPDVFLRELLQNAVDAYTARALAGVSEASGTIRVRAMGDAEIVFSDDGIGLTEDEVHRFLATIGQSSKRLEETPGARDFLGQFGIGLLACFLVSDSIEVHTRSARSEDAPTLRWFGRADGTYELSVVDLDMEPGTRVRLRAKPGHVGLFESGNVREGLERYGQLLPHRIELTTADGVERVDAPPPWRTDAGTLSERRAAIMAYGRAIFGIEFLDFIPLSSAAGGVDGVAYVLPHASVIGARRADRVYLKGMLLSEKAERLLPDWAFLVKAILDVRDLCPLASREAFVEDDALDAARETLGGCVKDYLREMARDAPERLRALLSLHHHPIKQLAEEDGEFLSLVARWLPFETSAGWMSLGDYLERSERISFARTIDAFRQVAPVVEAQGDCVINAGYTHDLAILMRWTELHERELVEIDAASLVESFADLSLDEREDVFMLVKVADLVLQPFKCSAEVKRFSPASLPALFSAGEDASFVRSIERTKEVTDELWTSVLDDLAQDPGRSPYARLTLNYDNPMVRRLSRVDDRELLRRLIEVLYVQTLLLGHHPLNAAEMNLVNESLSGLIEHSLDRGGRLLQ